MEWWEGEGKDLHCTLVLARLSGQGGRLIYSCRKIELKDLIKIHSGN